MSDGLEVAVTDAQGPRAVLSVVGVLDFTTARAFHEQAARAAVTYPQVVLDLSRVTFCDSSGLNALLRLRRHLDLLGGRLALAGPPAQMLRLLTTTGLDTVLSVHGSTAEAVAVQAASPAAPGA